MDKLIIKVDKNINILCATKFLVDENYKKTKEEFFTILNSLKDKYDLIIIDNSSECFFEYTKEILKRSDLILFLVEPNLIELKKSKVNEQAVEEVKSKIANEQQKLKRKYSNG